MTTAELPIDAGVLALSTARSAGLVISAPLLWDEAPTRVRALVVIALAAISYSAAKPWAEPFHSMYAIALAAPLELFLGVAMGFVVRATFAAVEVIGDVVSPMLGLGAASLFNPHWQSSETPLTRMLRLLIVYLALLLGLHRILIGGLLASFRLVPLGKVAGVSLALPPLLDVVASSLAMGVRLAVPLFGVLLITQIGLAFVSRAAPAMQLFSVGFAVSLVSGLLVLLLVLPDMTHELGTELSHVAGRLDSLLLAFAPAAL